ncbi:MAG TPA: hypothetical protein PKL31_16015 [Fulvivirga sp.]|nr:hypothetical protein [Fulvivirga sp.]
MQRTPFYAGKVKDKDENDILYWANSKTAKERLAEAWRLHCANHNIDPKTPLNRKVSKAHKRQ